MATLTKSFPGGIYPYQYTPAIAGIDYMPTMGELINFDEATLVSRSATLMVYKFSNGIEFRVIGSSFTFDAQGNATGGTVTSVQTRTSGGAVIDNLTGLSLSLPDFQAAAESFNGWNFQQWLMKTNDTVNGSSGSDDVYGFAGNDTLNGGAGDDFLVGGEGRDTYDGGSGIDQLSFDDAYSSPNALRGVIVNAANGTATDQFGNAETFTSIESFRGTQFADTFTGSSLNEDFMGLGGADRINGGGGFDVVRYHRDVRRGGDSGVNVDLQSGVARDGFGKTDTLTSIEGVRATDFADILNGSTARNILRGEGGNDLINGRAGNDDLIGGGGLDSFYFSTALNASTNVDNILDYSVAEDTIRLDNAAFTALVGTGVMTAAQFHFSTAGTAHDADDRIIYDTDGGGLYYDSDGTGSAARVLFARVDPGLSLTSADFFIY
ncbi:hemolysin type calcium-binding protein [Neorhizobium sp. R1-B]|uniref:calcium-binding protein n=1 Tax=unclassified Neorhizobium TaxID=2629175 RepID=UPI0010520F1A|nr:MULTISPECIES: calcium-binding protein [unclassified Neorhizobium]TCV66262.1 hemolysin type calcium-binding protein [Neorhizobium sp. S3-V5DH]TDX72584.1 hemolysin type calcium-binding protein [Neorhizobium sp. R1-B]